MKALAVDILLAVAVAAVWLAAIALLRLRTALDRLHCATFVNVAAGLAVTLAVLVQDGATSRSWKTAAILILTLLVGSATSHAVGRALHLRDAEER